MNREISETSFREIIETDGIKIDSEGLTKLFAYYELLMKMKNRINLAGPLSSVETVKVLFLDSLLGLPLIPAGENLKVIDTGCGAGFPGLVLKIVRPNISLTLLDSANKKIAFTRRVCVELGLKNVEFLSERAEEKGHDPEYRETFDLSVTKAFAELPLLIELCSPFLKIGGKMAAWKGSSYKDEIKDTGEAWRIPGLEKHEPFIFDPQCPGRDTVILTFNKISHCPPEYPRSNRVIRRKPMNSTFLK